MDTEKNTEKTKTSKKESKPSKKESKPIEETEPIEECSICRDSYTKIVRKKVICPNKDCRYELCVTCFKNYMNSTLNDPHCMQCKVAWTYEFLGSFLTKTYIGGDYRAYREKILIDREMNLLPQSQGCAERTMQGRVYAVKISDVLKEQNAEYDKKTCTNNELLKQSNNIVSERDEKTLELRQLIKDLQSQVSTINDKYASGINEIAVKICKNDNNYNIKDREYNNNIRILKNKQRKVLGKDINTERREFIKSCPAEECRGFLSTHWKCGICEVRVCNKCHEIIYKPTPNSVGENINTDNEVYKKEKEKHECNEDSVKTAELLKKDSKGCPKCGIMIYKIEGCDQMWCTSCNTAFSWRSMKILANNTIHNPHFFEYMRRVDNGTVTRNPLDIQCGGLPEAYEASRILNKLIIDEYRDGFSVENIMEFLRNAIHMEHVEIGETYRVGDDNSNDDLRVKYLVNDITKDEMKKSIVHRETKINKNRMISQILNMFVNVSNDIMQRILIKVTDNNKSVKKITVNDEILNGGDKITTFMKNNSKEMSEFILIYYNTNMIDKPFTKIHLNEIKEFAGDNKKTFEDEFKILLGKELNGYNIIFCDQVIEFNDIKNIIQVEENKKVRLVIKEIYDKEAHALRDYYNECMQKMSKQFNMCTPRLSEQWVITKLKT